MVVEAYAQLVAEGFLVARAGAATRVARSPATTREAPAGADRAAGALRLPDRGRRPVGVPAARVAGRAARALRDMPDAGLGYGDRSGAPVLRATLAAYLGRARGVAAEPGDVVVTTGITQAIALLARTLRRAGVSAIAVEDPGFPPHRMVLAREGLRVVPVPVDAGGLVVDALDRADVGAVLVTPSHQLPLGMALAPERRAALVAWAAAREAWILEDDYDGEYRFDRDPVGALQALAPARVTYLGSASKTLAPALRLGWMVVAPELLEAVGEAKLLADAGCPQLDQLALARFIERGELDRHLRRMRASTAAGATCWCRAGRASCRRWRSRASRRAARLRPAAGRGPARAAAGGGVGARRRALRLRARRRRAGAARLRQPAGAVGGAGGAGAGRVVRARLDRVRRRRRRRAGRRTRAPAARPAAGRRRSRSRGGRRRGSGCPRRWRCRRRARRARR